jgi:predicted DsbA family dithiol-disulfide isomerase
MPSLRVDVWSDLACPWCYVGKRHLEQALARFPHAAQVEVTWRSFELDPSAPPAPREPGQGYAERLARKYRMPVAEAQQRIDEMTARGAGLGIGFRFDRVQAASTFDAHRLLHHARQHGQGGALKERLLRAYFAEGVLLTDRGALAGLAAEVGLDREAALAALDGGAHADAVRADEALAQELGIHAVPCFVFGPFGVSGAQPPEVLLQALGRAWQERAQAAG